MISKKYFFIGFLDGLGLFIGENPIFTKKNFRRSAVCRLARFHGCPNEKLSVSFLKDAFKLETSHSETQSAMFTRIV
jgi:hypothetical protein